MEVKITGMLKAPDSNVVDRHAEISNDWDQATVKLEAINKLKPCKITIRKYDVDGKNHL